MPYVPSEKTPNPSGIVKDGKAQDRILIDKAVIKLSEKIAKEIKTNRDILFGYLRHFCEIGMTLLDAEKTKEIATASQKVSYEGLSLSETIYDVGKAYNYEGAFLGELNYAITRLIQEVPKRLVEQGKQTSELRYFIYAYTVSALVRASYFFNRLPDMYGIGGVFTDIKDEYKRRVNPSYEAAQIVKSGDCYDTPYLTKLIEVVNQHGIHIGYQEIMIKREDDNKLDVSGKTPITYYPKK